MRYDNRLFLLFAVPLLLWIPVICYAEDVCLTEDSARRLIVEITQCRMTDKEIPIYKSTIAELNKQIATDGEISAAKDVTLQEDGKTIDRYKELATYQTQACEEKIAAAKPTFAEGAMKIIGGFVVGAIATAFLLL